MKGTRRILSKPAAISLQEAAISSLASNSHSHPVRPVVLVDRCPPLKNGHSLLSVLTIIICDRSRTVLLFCGAQAPKVLAAAVEEISQETQNEKRGVVCNATGYNKGNVQKSL
ncbi:MAG: hypothetical protein HFG23_09510 [Anaerotruncus sp.]|nr:hypothetical protein [Anaerotruncus sp.]